MSDHNTTHGACGKTWRQRGNKTGHCAACHETFEGVALFDAHQRISPNGGVICTNPADMLTGPKDAKVPLRLVNGTWRGPALPEGVTFGGAS